MPLANPIPVDDFWKKLPIESAQFWPNEPKRIDRTAGGTILAASLGSTLWFGRFKLFDDVDFARHSEIEALLSVASRPGKAFFAYDPRFPFPAADPAGLVYGASAPVIHSIQDNQNLRISGLPPNYTITAGDLVGFSYGANPTRYTLHRFVSGVVANAAGTTDTSELTPFLPSGLVSGRPANFVRPAIKVILEPNPAYPTGQPSLMQGAEFSFVQTLR